MPATTSHPGCAISRIPRRRLAARWALAASAAALLAGCAGGAGATATVTIAQTTVTVTAPGQAGGAGKGGTPDVNTNTAPAGSTAAAAQTTELLAGTAKPKLPRGAAGQVAIVATGPSSDRDGSVAVIIRNNTDQPIRHITAVGSATDSSGALVGSGKDQGFNPVLVAPGQIAIGYVYFSGKPPASSKFDIEIAGESADYHDGALNADVSALNLTGDNLIGSVTNNNGQAMSGPIGVSVLCFTKAGEPLAFVAGGGYTEADKLAPAAKTTFSISLSDENCPTYLVGASGYSF